MKIFGYLILASIIFFTTCNTTEPPPEDNRKLTLTFEDATCIEAWINITTENIQLPASINIFINDSISQISILNTKDSLLYIDSLLPNKTYKLKAASIDYGVMSSEISVTTMDTTSHNFTWQFFEFGDPGISSFLFDAFIFNENKIYVVGEIYLNDSLGQIDSKPYGSAVWNGNSWDISRIETKWPSGVTENLSPTSILVLSESDIWYTAGGVHYWDGEKITTYWLNGYPGIPDPLFEEDQWLLNIWGNSYTNIYISGHKGALARFDGEKWFKIESHTNGDLYDIYGIENIKKNIYEIYCPISFQTNPFYGEIIKISENDIVEMVEFGLEKVFSVWGIKNTKIYGSGRSIFVNNSTGWEEIDFDNYYSKLKIRGSALNNIFVVGGLGFV